MLAEIDYNGAHSVSFYAELKEFEGEDSNRSKNTWRDWHLAPVSRPVIAPPTKKTAYIDVPFRNGKIDVSTAFTNGQPTYENRTGSLDFIVVNGYGKWNDRYSDIMNYFNSSPIRMWLDDDTWEKKYTSGRIDKGVWYYSGLIWVSNWTSNNDGTWSTITFDYDVEPYKWRNLPVDPDIVGGDVYKDKSL